MSKKEKQKEKERFLSQSYPKGDRLDRTFVYTCDYCLFWHVSPTIFTEHQNYFHKNMLQSYNDEYEEC